MTPYECDIWVAEQIQMINLDKKYFNYVLDKVIYWRLEFSKNITFQRDKKWFNESLPIFQKMWNYVEFLRKNKMQLDLFKEYIETVSVKKDKEIMNMVAKLYDTSAPNYSEYIYQLRADIAKNKCKKDEKYAMKLNSTGNLFSNHEEDSNVYSGYMFVDYDNAPTVPAATPKTKSSTIKSSGTTKTPKSSLPSLPADYMFTDD